MSVCVSVRACVRVRVRIVVAIELWDWWMGLLLIVPVSSYLLRFVNCGMMVTMSSPILYSITITNIM